MNGDGTDAVLVSSHGTTIQARLMRFTYTHAAVLSATDVVVPQVRSKQYYWCEALPGEMQQVMKCSAGKPYSIDRNALPPDIYAPIEASGRAHSRVPATVPRNKCLKPSRLGYRSGYISWSDAEVLLVPGIAFGQREDARCCIVTHAFLCQADPGM